MTMRDLQLRKPIGSFVLAELMAVIFHTAVLVKWRKLTILVSYHKFWSSNGRNRLQMMDSWKMNHSFMKLTSFSKMLTEQYATVLFVYLLFGIGYYQ